MRRAAAATSFLRPWTREFATETEDQPRGAGQAESPPVPLTTPGHLNVRVFGIKLGRRCLPSRPALVRVNVPFRNKVGYRKRMAPPHTVALAASDQVLLRILTHRLEQAIPNARVLLQRDHQRL